ncbi:class I SAM-dependent methyltransferase [Candidatus Parcubacteria bacterium]|nr:class I SAM-dependent methyltransferase [Candidatus Parcubacteria bacterium]
MENLKIKLKQAYSDLLPLSKRWEKEEFEHIRTLFLLKEKMGGFENKKILEVGSGLGIVVHALNLLGANTSGIDKYILEEWGIEGVKELWQKFGIDIKVESFFECILEEEGYDAIISENVIEHLKYNQKKFLEKIYTALKPGGIMILSTPNLVTFLKQARFLFGKSVYWDFDDFFLNGQPYGHCREFTANELKRMADVIGFKDAEVEAHNTYFKKKWMFNFKKFPRFLSWLLSEVFQSRRDTLYLIAKK